MPAAWWAAWAACAADRGEAGLWRFCILFPACIEFALPVWFSGCCSWLVLTFSSGITGLGSESRRSAAIFFKTEVGIKALDGESVVFLEDERYGEHNHFSGIKDKINCHQPSGKEYELKVSANIFWVLLFKKGES